MSISKRLHTFNRFTQVMFYKVLSFRVPMLCVSMALVAVSLLCPESLYSQRREISIDITFRKDSNTFDESYGNNREGLRALDSLFTKINSGQMTNLPKIELYGWTSPEPGVYYNTKLSERRAQSIYDYILSRWGIADSLLVIKRGGIAWDMLRDEVMLSQMKYRDEVLDILDNVPEERWEKLSPSDASMTLVDSRQKHLMDLRGGQPYWDMYHNIFPKLRYSSQVFVFDDELPTVAREVDFITPLIEPMLAAELPVADPEMVAAPLAESKPFVSKPILAVKTNLIYDLCITPNLEVEVPIGKKVSVGVQGICGWWLQKDNNFCWQIQAADLELRYWFGNMRDKSKSRVMTGWFVGAFAGAGFYDFQLHEDRGVQGDFYVMTGLSGGYAKSLRRNLYLEFVLGVGYMVNDYQLYTVRDNRYLIENGYAMRMQSLIPTKLEVNLGWLLFTKDRRARR